MLNTEFSHRELTFPPLRFITKVNFSSWSNDSKSMTPLYKLDWDEFDRNLAKRIGHELPYKALPDEYEKQVRSLKFAISHNYRQGISHHSNLAQAERNRFWPYDTMVRDICLNVVAEAIRTAFFLLKDCTYDQDTGGFDRSDDRSLFDNMLVWRFWVHQTGRGTVWRKANFDYLELLPGYIEEHDPEQANRVREFLENMREHTKSWEVYHPPPTDEDSG